MINAPHYAGDDARAILVLVIGSISMPFQQQSTSVHTERISLAYTHRKNEYLHSRTFCTRNNESSLFGRTLRDSPSLRRAVGTEKHSAHSAMMSPINERKLRFASHAGFMFLVLGPNNNMLVLLSYMGAHLSACL